MQGRTTRRAEPRFASDSFVAAARRSALPSCASWPTMTPHQFPMRGLHGKAQKWSAGDPSRRVRRDVRTSSKHRHSSNLRRRPFRRIIGDIQSQKLPAPCPWGWVRATFAGEQVTARTLPGLRKCCLLACGSLWASPGLSQKLRVRGWAAGARGSQRRQVAKKAPGPRRVRATPPPPRACREGREAHTSEGA